MSGSPRSLQLADWPDLDRQAWEAACRPGIRVRRGGGASHLKAVTRGMISKRYGLFLDYLQRSRRLDHKLRPEPR